MKALSLLLLLAVAAPQETRGPAAQGAPPAQTRQQDTADSASSSGVVFTLDEESNFVTGCFWLCLCPIFLFDDLRGTFELSREISQDPDFRSFAISDVSWFAGSGPNEIWITGAGHYRVGTQDGQAVHQLVLELAVGDAEPATYDSGLVPGGVPGQKPTSIDITIDRYGQQCWDNVFTVSAVPAPKDDFIDYGLSEPSDQFAGCLPPCLCAVTLRDLEGGFSLLLPSASAPEEYPLVRVDWRLTAFTPIPAPGGEPVGGAGRFQTSPAGEVRLQLYVPDGSTAGRYDSGWVVPDVAFPSIAATATEGNGVCLNRGFDVHAEPLP